MGLRTKFAVVGDPHLALSQGEPDAFLEIDPGRKLHGLSLELLDETLRQVDTCGDLDAVVILGDLTRDSEDFNHEAAFGLLSKLNLPVYAVLGNHDLVRSRPPESTYPGVHRLERGEVCDLYRDHGFPDAQSRYVAELPGGVDLIVCDGNLSLDEMKEQGVPTTLQDGGQLGQEHRDWLAQMLDDTRKSNRLPLVAVHHSIAAHSPAERPGHMLADTFRFWQLHDAPLVRRYLAGFRVPLVLSGHLHAQSAAASDGVLNVTTSACVSYPHAWRTVEVHDEAIYISSTRLESIPSVAGLQAYSRREMNAGMAALVERKAEGVPMLAPAATALARLVADSGWWTCFSEGSFNEFKIEPELTAGGGFAQRLLLQQASAMLYEYKAWKAKHPDPWQMEILLDE